MRYELGANNKKNRYNYTHMNWSDEFPAGYILTYDNGIMHNFM